MIVIENLTITLPSFILGPVSLTIEKGSFFTLMGPTGSGKTLLLESLSGLLQPNKGKILVNGLDITDTPPEQRSIGLVYQDHCLFPHLTVLENVIYGQRYTKLGKQEGQELAFELMEMLSIMHLKKRKPLRLSGGEKQRVALARALACQPSIVLLDEPLSSLDPQFREELRRNLKQLHTTSDATFFMVTHDFVDALTLSDTAAVIKNGCIQQSGKVLDIFHRPDTAFIADFVGMKNIIEATYEDDTCHFCGITIPKPANIHHSRGYIALRPENITISPIEQFDDRGANEIKLRGNISGVIREGFTWIATVQCQGTIFSVHLDNKIVLDRRFDKEKEVVLGFNTDDIHHITESYYQGQEAGLNCDDIKT
ncbi:MAG: Fe3+/spermidine/putrescine ABC transporter ATP-binding protein [Desulfobulbus propionicus]|nr:MAG: Fe3+/spermidine/putrescine ABC transporter ATP-binding protein [Desulfobulbus propionicus]